MLEQIAEFQLQIGVVQLALREFRVPICHLYTRVEAEYVTGSLDEEIVVFVQRFAFFYLFGSRLQKLDLGLNGSCANAPTEKLLFRNGVVCSCHQIGNLSKNLQDS